MKSLVALFTASTLALTACAERPEATAVEKTAVGAPTPEQSTTLSATLKKLDDATTLDEALTAYQVQGLALNQKTIVNNAYDQVFFKLAPPMKAKGESVIKYAITHRSKRCNFSGECGP